METTIYSLRDEIGLTRYIGKTVRTLKARLSHHIAEAKAGKKTRKHNWIRSILNRDKVPRIDLIEMVDGDGCKEEESWIIKLRSMGWPLVNLTNGGEGLKGFKPHFSEEHRAKISAAKKGKTFTAEHRRNLSAARKRVTPNISLEGKARRAAVNSARCKGIPLTEEHRAKLRKPKRPRIYSATNINGKKQTK